MEPCHRQLQHHGRGEHPRNYHSVALLLQDGRVLSGGGGLCADPCDTRPLDATNHPDFEYYSPGYLFAPSGAPAVRPVIVSAPGTAGYNTQIQVTTSDTNVTSFVLIRMGAATHGVDNDQRRIPLSISGQSGTNYTVTTPANSGIGTPGYYMLFCASPRPQSNRQAQGRRDYPRAQWPLASGGVP